MKILIVFLVAAVGGCHTRKPDDEEAFALGLLAAARATDGIRADQVDAELVERVRRSQLTRRMTLDTHDRAKLLEALAGESGPDKQYPVAERPKKQRERASRGLAANAQGQCRAAVDENETATRVKFLTEAIPDVPREGLDARAALASALEGAEVIRLTCAAGPLGILVVRGSDGKLRAVDLYEIGRGSIEWNPNDPGMK